MSIWASYAIMAGNVMAIREEVGTTMLRLPYGISDFTKIAQEGYHFVDRTPFVAQIEQMNEPYLFFLRPRRFGKSLFISLLQCYYGLEYRAEFAQLFGAYAIGQTPTPLANQFLVLKLDFRHVNTQSRESTFAGFLENVKQGISNFLSTYGDYYRATDHAYILATEEPAIVISRLFERTKNQQVSKRLPYKIYLLIDEYDNFANELIADWLAQSKQHLTDYSFIQTFYTCIKAATGNGVVDRIFITGISPLNLGGLTAGFNIGKNISSAFHFHNMMGFTETEVCAILSGLGVSQNELPQTIANLRQWYNGYCFNENAATRLYNPDMVLYYGSTLGPTQEYPVACLDTHISRNVGKSIENLAPLNELIIGGQVAAQLAHQFSFEKDFSRDDLVSLLFYLGIVTIKARQLSRLVFETPNMMIAQRYFALGTQ